MDEAAPVPLVMADMPSSPLLEQNRTEPLVMADRPVEGWNPLHRERVLRPCAAVTVTLACSDQPDERRHMTHANLGGA